MRRAIMLIAGVVFLIARTVYWLWLKRFMRQFDNNKRSRIVLSELMRMAQSLGIRTLVEGVETKAQHDFLYDTGCDMMQGYLFGKPQPLENGTF